MSNIPPKKLAAGKEAAEQSPTPRLCGIYLRDVISLVDPTTAHALRQVSAYSQSTTSRVGAAGQLPRRQFSSTSIFTFPVGLPASFLLHSIHDHLTFTGR